MSNRLFQNIIHQTADVVGRVVGVIDDSCIIVACSDPTRIGETMGAVRSDLVSVGDTFVADNFTYKPFGSSSHPDFAVFVSGIDDSARKDATVLSVAMNSVKQRYDEKYDKVNFIVLNISIALPHILNLKLEISLFSTTSGRSIET